MQLVKQPDFLRSLLVVTMLRSATYCLDAGFNTFFSYGYEFLCKRRLLHFFCGAGGYCTCVSGVLIIFLLHLLSFQAATTFACAVAATTFTLVSGGYYKVDDAKAEAAMRPSRTFNSIIDAY